MSEPSKVRGEGCVVQDQSMHYYCQLYTAACFAYHCCLVSERRNSLRILPHPAAPAFVMMSISNQPGPISPSNAALVCSQQTNANINSAVVRLPSVLAARCSFGPMCSGTHMSLSSRNVMHAGCKR